MKKGNPYTTIILSISLFVIGFAIFNLVFYFGDWERLFLVSSLGFFCGLVAAPEIDPKTFSNPKRYQSISGMFAGLISGYLLTQSTTGVLIGLLLGGILGFTAHFWVRHVQIP